MKRLVATLVALMLAGTGCVPPGDVAERVTAQNRDDAFGQVRAQIAEAKADVRSVGTCHERMHEIGRAAFEAYGVAALAVGDEWCNAGYIHGIIETALAGAEDPVSMMGELCDGVSATSFSGWECRHGVGHGLMYYTVNDLPRSVALCESAPGDASACINGVWMENFVAEETQHPTDWRRDDDSLYPCDANVADGVADCYLYAPVWYLERHAHDYDAAFDWCLGAGQFVETCMHGVGAQAMKDGVGDPDAAARACGLAPEGYRDECIAGMAGILAFHHAALGPAEAWCERRAGEDRDACEARLDALRPMFIHI